MAFFHHKSVIKIKNITQGQLELTVQKDPSHGKEKPHWDLDGPRHNPHTSATPLFTQVYFTLIPERYHCGHLLS